MYTDPCLQEESGESSGRRAIFESRGYIIDYITQHAERRGRRHNEERRAHNSTDGTNIAGEIGND